MDTCPLQVQKAHFKQSLIHFRDAKKSERVRCGLEKRVSVTEINQKHQNSMGKTLFRLKLTIPSGCIPDRQFLTFSINFGVLFVNMSSTC